MKEISKKTIEETVKNEYEAISKWKKQGKFRRGKMMIDTEDGEIWSDVFLDENSFKRYKQDTIDELDCENDNIIKGFAENAIIRLKRAGWVITD